ncbi:MAG: HlyD family secretion protein [Ruminococcus sp.]|nr:MAG: HlyD family secretion protein [Ruminococcus sp.]
MNKKIFAAAAAVAVTAGGAAAIIANASSAKAKAEEDVSYREYSVSKGNITVGTEESGTLSLDREYVSFPCTAEVTEVYVKTGTSVKEGDALLKVDPDDVAEAKKQYELKLKAAQNALDEAKDNLTSGTLKAQQELESAQLKGTSAQSEYELYLSKQENEKAVSEKNLADLKEQLEEYQSMTLTYDDDYAKLTTYEDKLSGLEAEYKAMEKQYREYQKTDTANNDALEAIKDEYSAYTEKISDTSEKDKLPETGLRGSKGSLRTGSERI